MADQPRAPKVASPAARAATQLATRDAGASSQNRSTHAAANTTPSAAASPHPAPATTPQFFEIVRASMNSAASATAASSVAFQVRKSLAEWSPPVASLMKALMSGDYTSRHDPFSR